MPQKSGPRKGTVLRKVTDDLHQVRCESGSHGLFREEVYVDAYERVMKYNLAFIHPGLFQADNGRVLGYDNAHGYHERHWKGRSEEVDFESYEKTLEKFLDELEKLKKTA